MCNIMDLIEKDWERYPYKKLSRLYIVGRQVFGKWGDIWG